MASDYIQATIDYEFANIGFLSLALKAAHRSKEEEGISDDGNRGLAKIGLCAVDIVETHNAIIEENGTRRDANKHEHWSTSKKGRAAACSILGITPYIVQSSRQQHQKPSSTVLDNALSAIIGAVWRDLEERNESVSNTRIKICSILRRIDQIIADTTDGSLLAAGETNAPVSEEDGGIQSAMPNETLDVFTPNEISDQNINPLDAFVFQWPNQPQFATLEGMSLDPMVWDGAGSEFDHALNDGPRTRLQITANLDHEISMTIDPFNQIEYSHDCIQFGGEQIFDAHRLSSHTDESTKAKSSPGKRKNSQDHVKRPLGSSTHIRLLDGELMKLNSIPDPFRSYLEDLLDHPQIAELSTDPSQLMQLRLLYFSIGSCQSLIDFKEQLHNARGKSIDFSQPAGLTLCASERLKEIFRLDSQETLCVLSRRFHVVKLLEKELDTPHQNDGMNVETPATFGTRHRVQTGNPIVRQEAALTDRLLCNFRPDLEKGTREFETFRRKISRLRRLAKILRILTQTYGFGVLALLPCGPTYSELSLTDNMLLTITEQRFGSFSNLLNQKQGLILKQLSEALEPALMAFIDGTLSSVGLFPIESVEASVIEGLPKGSPAIIEHLMGPRSVQPSGIFH